MTSAQMLSPADAFLLAYLPAQRLAHVERQELLRRLHPSTPELQHAVDFATQALRIERARAAEAETQLAALAERCGVAWPGAASDKLERAWLDALEDSVAPLRNTPALEAAWRAGLAARRTEVAMEVACLLAYLRSSAADLPELRAEAAARATEIRQAVEALTAELRATGLPLAAAHADYAEKMVSYMPREVKDLQPTTVVGYRLMNEWSEKLRDCMATHARHLGVPAPPEPTAPPGEQELFWMTRILAQPENLDTRRQLAELAAQRGDPRAELIRLQLGPETPERAHRCADLIAMHPAWSAPLVALGARDVKFHHGFPEEITVDAEVWLSRGSQLQAQAPLRTLHIRNARDRVGTLVRDPSLARISRLDLDSQGVTDADLEALASSPSASGLTWLDLRYNPISARGIEALAASNVLRNLELVNLDGNPDDPVERLEYYDETNTHRVPTAAGKALEAKYGALRWLHPGSSNGRRSVSWTVIGKHRGRIARPAFSPDGTRFVAGDAAGALVLYARRGDAFERTAEVRVPAAGKYSKPEVKVVAWSPDGQFIATDEGAGVRLRSPDDLRELAWAKNRGGRRLAFGGNGAWLAALSQDCAWIFAVPSLEALHFVSLRRGDYEYFAVDHLAADAHGSTLLVSDDGGSDETAMGMTTAQGEHQVSVIDGATGQVLRALEVGHPAFGLEHDPWRQRFLTLMYDDIGVWTAAGELERRLPFQRADLCVVTKRWIALGRFLDRAGVNEVKFFDPVTWTELGADAHVSSSWMVGSPEGDVLVSSGAPERGEFPLFATRAPV